MASLHRLPPEEFAHRLNDDGSMDAICLKCFATVTRAPHEATLGIAEAAHDCWQREESALRRISPLAMQA